MPSAMMVERYANNNNQFIFCDVPAKPTKPTEQKKKRTNEEIVIVTHIKNIIQIDLVFSLSLDSDYV
jgi:hypothetical protein